VYWLQLAYVQDKLFIGLEHADLAFGVKDRILGPAVRLSAFCVSFVVSLHVKHKLRRVELLMKLYLRATGCHLPYGITECYLPPNTSELTTP